MKKNSTHKPYVSEQRKQSMRPVLFMYMLTLSLILITFIFTGLALLRKTENTGFIIIFILLLISITVICCNFMSKKYISPVMKRIENLKKQEFTADNTEKSYTEIDIFFEYLKKKEKELSDAKTKIDKLLSSGPREIDPDDYEYFREGLKTLTKSERNIFDLYLSGKTSQEILDIAEIKERTLKFHNSNIYSKLGVQSRKELLRYASAYEKEKNGDNND